MMSKYSDYLTRMQTINRIKQHKIAGRGNEKTSFNLNPIRSGLFFPVRSGGGADSAPP